MTAVAGAGARITPGPLPVRLLGFWGSRRVSALNALGVGIERGLTDLGVGFVWGKALNPKSWNPPNPEPQALTLAPETVKP